MQFVKVDAFAWLINLINFCIMSYLFIKVAILPMIDAVRVRKERIQKRIDEVQRIVVEARELEATYKAQYDRLEQEKAELKAAAEREIARVKQRIQHQAESEAAQAKARAQGEADKRRREALAALREELSRKSLEEAERLLRAAFDKEAQGNLNDNFLAKVGVASAA